MGYQSQTFRGMDAPSSRAGEIFWFAFMCFWIVAGLVGFALAIFS